MSYFDFVNDDDEQEGTTKSVKPKRSAAEEADRRQTLRYGTADQVQSVLPAPPPNPNAIDAPKNPPEMAAYQNQRNDIAKRMQELAIKITTEQGPKGVSRGNFSGADPAKIPGMVEAFRGKSGKADPNFDELKRLGEEYNKLQATSTVPAQIGQSLQVQDAPRVARGLEQAQQNVDALAEKVMLASTPDDKQKAMDQHQQALEVEADLKKQAKANQPAPPSPGTGVDSFKEVWESNMSSEADMLEKMGAVYTKALEFNNELRFGTKTSPQLAVASVTRMLGADAVNKVYGPMMKAIEAGKHHDELAQQVQKEGAEGVAAAEAQGKPREAQIYQELMQLNPMRTFLGGLAFVLTSLVIGPKMAAMIFVDMDRRGMLKRELDQIQQRVEMAQGRQKMNETAALQMRSRAADVREEADQQESARMYKWAETRPSVPKDDTAKYLHNLWGRHEQRVSSMAGALEKEIDPKQRAFYQRELQMAMQHAEDARVRYEKWIAQNGTQDAGIEDEPAATEGR